MDIHFIHATHFYPAEVAALDPIIPTLTDYAAVANYLWYIVNNEHQAKQAALALRQRAKQDYFRLLHDNFPQHRDVAP